MANQSAQERAAAEAAEAAAKAAAATERRPSGGGKSSKPVRVDLVNPTPARRVIDSGIVGASVTVRTITMESGDIRRNVELAEWVAKELRARTKGRGKEHSDIVVYPAGKAPDPSAPSADADEDEDEDFE